MNFAQYILKTFGWSVNITVPDYPKCIICVAPHTSNWDFILGELAIHAVNRSAGFLMKSSWFFFPLGSIFRSIGGVPVERKNKTISLVDAMVEKFNNSERLAIAITPEGTRKRVEQWHTGFLRIAYEANVPITLGVIDYPNKTLKITETFTPTGDIDADMRAIKEYYKPCVGIYPNKFTTGL
jgi:1-acyl-sn-glycerol-3-phosphate acyltransferase